MLELAYLLIATILAIELAIDPEFGLCLAAALAVLVGWELRLTDKSNNEKGME